ncbi:MAG: acetate kinase [Deltaproteobacteria bacterium]|nr:MAG: acetate kinase [Deltaproteobacteria bacterium]PIE73462.1 MAG: acetate kinase [Deltaproteobacteria bacterium]
MKILVINSGSSSIKFKLMEMSDESVLANGLVERIGEEVGLMKCAFFPGSPEEQDVVIEEKIADHEKGMLLAVETLSNPEYKALRTREDIQAVGHRLVHGGESFHQPVMATEEVLQSLEEILPLAPLHNPANILGVRVSMELFPGVPQVLVFDTAFHQSLPPEAYLYPLPYSLYEEHRIRRYGFHGTSHKFVTEEYAKLSGKNVSDVNIISIHLGNGCSMTAVRGGKSVDTTMGLTPLEGLVMGTRSGDIDPAIHAFLARNKDLSIDEIDTILNKQSGLKGICGLNDMRDIHDEIEKGNSRAALALAVQTYRNKKYIGAYMAILGHVDAIVFTAGIGENDDVVRQRSVEGLESFGVVMDLEKNKGRIKAPRLLSTDESKVAVWCIPTNEELAIAREVVTLVRE